METIPHIALTGFMGVGKSSVARHLSNLLKFPKLDLDTAIEEAEARKIHEIIAADGIDAYRRIETVTLRRILSSEEVRILSLGGGTWTIAENRELIRSHGFTSIWLEASFDHCWRNICGSRKERPLAKDKEAARELFISRQKDYCLADWHFVIKPGDTSYDVAHRIFDELIP